MDPRRKKTLKYVAEKMGCTVYKLKKLLKVAHDPDAVNALRWGTPRARKVLQITIAQYKNIFSRETLRR
jgi:hypothetical protein